MPSSTDNLPRMLEEWMAAGVLAIPRRLKPLPKGSPSPGNHHHHHLLLHHLLHRPWLVVMALLVVLLTLLPLVAVVASVAVDSMSRCPSFPSNSGGSQSFFRLGFCSLICGSRIEATMAHSMRWLRESWSCWVLAVFFESRRSWTLWHWIWARCRSLILCIITFQMLPVPRELRLIETWCSSAQRKITRNRAGQRWERKTSRFCRFTQSSL